MAKTVAGSGCCGNVSPGRGGDGAAPSLRVPRTRHPVHDAADAVQKAQAVAADDVVFGVHDHLVEEGVDRRAQGRHGGHRGGEILGLQAGRNLRLRPVEGGEEGLFGVRFGEFRVRVEGILDPVLLLLLAQDVVGALVARQQVGPVLGLKKGLQGPDAVDQKHQIILPAQREAGVNDIMADALGAEVHLQAVGEEGEEVIRVTIYVAKWCLDCFVHGSAGNIIPYAGQVLFKFSNELHP